jgi:hypothetical protein
MGAGGVIQQSIHEKIAILIPVVMNSCFYPTNSGARDRIEQISVKGSIKGDQDDLEFLGRLIVEATRPRPKD